MKVILMSDLRQRGRRGQVVDVKPGFARNFLLPNGLALPASPGNIKRFEHEKKKIDARHDEALAVANAEAARISGVKLELKKRAMETGTLYGSVSVADIVAALHEKGIEVDRRQVDLVGGIKSVGDHVVRVELHADVVAELAVAVAAED
ncbi:MAG: 50S ribosomal protein L9 [Thermoanaerobaculia bacterium]